MSANTSASKTTRNALALIIAGILSNGIQLLWQLALGTTLGPEAYGIYGTVVSLMAVSTALANFGLGVILIRDVARDPAAMGRYWTARLFLQTILGLLAYLMAVGAAILAGYDHIILAYTAIGGLSLLIDIFGTITGDMLIVQERMTLRSIIEVGSILLRVVFAAIVLALGWGLLGVYAVTLVTGVLRSVLMWLSQTSQGTHLEMPLDRPLARYLFWESAPLAAAAFFNLLYQHIDKLITTERLGAVATGYLNPAFYISSGVIEVLNMTILTALFPYMARQYDPDDKQKTTYSHQIAILVRLMFVFSLFVALSITLFAEPLVLMIFKAQYAPTIGVLRILIWFTFLTMIGNVLVQAMQVQNQQRRVLWIRAGGLFVNVIFTTAALNLFRDPQGAALSAALAQALVLLLLFMQFPSLMARASQGAVYVARIAILSVITGAVMLLVGQIHFILGGLVGLIVYAALIWRWGLEDADRVLMQQILAVIPGQAWLRTRLAAR